MRSRTGRNSFSRNWQKAGRGTRATPGSPSSCGRASNGTTASRLLPPTSNAPGTCCSANRRRSCGSTRAKPGTATSRTSYRMDHAVTFVLKRSQPAFLMLLASGMSPDYPCHVTPRDMRTHPIGTGPFKFAEFKPNEYIRVVKNPDYWKPGRPYLDAVEWTIIPNRSTQTLAFIAGKFNMSFPYEVTLQSVRDIQKQAPNAICEMTPTPVAMNLLVNRDAAPFNDPDIRRAMQLTIDRKSFLDIIAEGQGDINGAMQSPPAGLWGLPHEILVTLPGYGPDVAANRAEARKLMAKHGYGPDHRLGVKVATRNIAQYRDPAIILIDQMKEIYIDGELDAVETANWFPKIARKDYMVGANLSGSGVDDPDAY